MTDAAYFGTVKTMHSHTHNPFTPFLMRHQRLLSLVPFEDTYRTTPHLDDMYITYTYNGSICFQLFYHHANVPNKQQIYVVQFLKPKVCWFRDQDAAFSTYLSSLLDTAAAGAAPSYRRLMLDTAMPPLSFSQVSASEIHSVPTSLATDDKDLDDELDAALRPSSPNKKKPKHSADDHQSLIVHSEEALLFENKLTPLLSLQGYTAQKLASEPDKSRGNPAPRWIVATWECDATSAKPPLIIRFYHMGSNGFFKLLFRSKIHYFLSNDHCFRYIKGQL